jgi:hypothetical protein
MKRWGTGWFIAVILVLLGPGIDRAGAAAAGQVVPPFGPLDQGGLPTNLREVAPHTRAPVGDAYPEGPYVFWTARKDPALPYLQWKWEITKTVDFQGGKRYLAQIGLGGGLVVTEFLDRTYEKPKPNESVLQFLENGRDYWMAFIVAPATSPPGNKIPSTLREVAPQTNAPIADPYPAGRYVFWTARKLPNIPPQQCKWERTKICNFLGGKR